MIKNVLFRLLSGFSAPKELAEGAGTKRRRERERAYRKQQAERLKHADVRRIPDVLSRQLARQDDRLFGKDRSIYTEWAK